MIGSSALVGGWQFVFVRPGSVSRYCFLSQAAARQKNASQRQSPRLLSSMQPLNQPTNDMKPSLNRIMLYVRSVEATCDFYERHFGFTCSSDPDDRITELKSPNGGAILMVHQAAKSVKTGQVTVKLVFDIEDVEGFKEQCSMQGLDFGSTHKADGYCFANAKDPDGNSISISSRAFAHAKTSDHPD
ncbi:VOC family protein [Paraburkholderia agricolaris]|uniref:VOC family protein n=1 Tax=Paraburkholderia agricolaris TaxID=2152888 RepID=UPI0038BA4551